MADFVSVDIYCHYSGGLCSSSVCPGGLSEICEVTSARDYYEQYVFPKLGPHQRGKCIHNPPLLVIYRPMSTDCLCLQSGWFRGCSLRSKQPRATLHPLQ